MYISIAQTARLKLARAAALLASHAGLSKKQLRELHALVEENEYAIRNAWAEHFGSHEH